MGRKDWQGRTPEQIQIVGRLRDGRFVMNDGTTFRGTFHAGTNTFDEIWDIKEYNDTTREGVSPKD